MVAPNFLMAQQFLDKANPRKVPLYVYKHNFQGPQSFSEFFVENGKYYGELMLVFYKMKNKIFSGVIHSDELIYTFKSLYFTPFANNSLETLFRKDWINFLVEFATTG